MQREIYAAILTYICNWTTSFPATAFGMLRSMSDQQNLTPAHARLVPCRSTLSCAELPWLLQCSTWWTEQWTNQPTPMSTKLDHSPHHCLVLNYSVWTEFLHPNLLIVIWFVYLSLFMYFILAYIFNSFIV